MVKKLWQNSGIFAKMYLWRKYVWLFPLTHTNPLQTNRSQVKLMSIAEFASELIGNYHWTYNHFAPLMHAATAFDSMANTASILQLLLSLTIATLLWDTTTQVLFGYSFARGNDIFSVKRSSKMSRRSPRVKDTTEADRASLRASYSIPERRKGSIFITHFQVVMLVTALQFAGAGVIFGLTLLITTPYNPLYSLDLLASTKFISHIILGFTGVILLLEGYFKLKNTLASNNSAPLKDEFRMSGNSGIKMVMIGLALLANPVVLVVLIVSYGVQNTQFGIVFIASMFVVAVVVRFTAMVAGYGAYQTATCGKQNTADAIASTGQTHNTDDKLDVVLSPYENEDCRRFYITKIIIGSGIVVAVGVSYLLY